jgi:co-chaperonin GroES (HSP10)
MKNKYVLIKELKQEVVTASGLILSEEKYNRKATAICSDSSVINVGDTIIKTIGRGTMFTLDDEDYEILHEVHVLGIIE